MRNSKFRRYSHICLLSWLVFLPGCNDEPATTTFTGRVIYFDTEEPVSGLPLKLEFSKLVASGITDLHMETVRVFNSVTDVNGNYTFEFNRSKVDTEADFWSIVVTPVGLIQMRDKSNYRNCEYWGKENFLMSDLNRITSYNFVVDSAAYLKVEFDKINHAADGLVTYGTCNVTYSATESSPDLINFHSIPTGYYDTTKTRIFYQIVTSKNPNPLFIDSDFITVHVGDTTEAKFEY